MRKTITTAALLFTIGATAAFVTGAQAKPVSDETPPAACGTRAGPPATYAHVIWIWMENHAFDQVAGGSGAPYTNALAAGCGLATNYRAVAHPSLPNYIAATSGGPQGVADDASPAAHPLAVPSLFEQASSAGSFEEAMPGACTLADAYPYAVKHNPQAYYTRIRTACGAGNLPLGTPSAGAFAAALATGDLPAFSFVTPNLCNDGHDCPVRSGDTWLATWIPRIVASPAYRAGRTVVVVTWDEDDRSHANHVPAIVLSPYTSPGTRSAAPFTHYSLLRTTEDLLGIRTHLGAAATAPSMRSAFGL